jgi:predicted nucleic acid-binding protein
MSIWQGRPLADRTVLDTSAIYALVSQSDNFHERASRTYRRLIDSSAELYATSYTLVESFALIHRRLGFEFLKAFVESSEDILKVFWVDQATHEAAWQEMVGNNGQGLSFVDWNAVIAARVLNARVFAFDSDFSSQGVTVIP